MYPQSAYIICSPCTLKVLKSLKCIFSSAQLFCPQQFLHLIFAGGLVWVSPQQSWGGQERSGFGRLGRACSCYFPSSSVSPASMVFFHHSHGSSCHFKVRMVNVRLQSGHFLLDGGYFNYKNPFWWHHVLLKWGHQSALNQTEGSICPSLCPCATVMSSECATLALTMCSKLLRY